MDLDSVVKFVQLVNLVVVPALVYGGTVLRDIREQLKIQNGRLVAAETWRVFHDKSDDERHSQIRSEMSHLRGAIEREHA